MPAPIAVAALGHHGRQIIAQWVGVVPLESFQHPHPPIHAPADFAPFHVHKLVGGHIIGQVEVLLAGVGAVERANAPQLGRPKNGVEGDVVFADEVDSFGLVVVPPLLPRLGFAVVVGPLDSGRKIANDRLEPDIERFVFVARHGHGDAPLGDVAGDSTAD